jgi:hypothetical protein
MGAWNTEAAITVLVSSRLSLHLHYRAPQILSAQIPDERQWIARQTNSKTARKTALFEHFREFFYAIFMLSMTCIV